MFYCRVLNLISRLLLGWMKSKCELQYVLLWCYSTANVFFELDFIWAIKVVSTLNVTVSYFIVGVFAMCAQATSTWYLFEMCCCVLSVFYYCVEFLRHLVFGSPSVIITELILLFTSTDFNDVRFNLFATLFFFCFIFHVAWKRTL